ncbi:MAG: hypothetical protein SFY70_12200 [Bacteroidia bacterium]|nr:hypothetical protein [Bacteroidia bacterium]
MGNLEVAATSTVPQGTTVVLCSGTNQTNHTLNIGGNIQHSGAGIVRFSSITAQADNDNPAGNEVLIVANSATADQTFQADGPISYWRVRIDKGTGAARILNIQASDPDFFYFTGRNAMNTRSGDGTFPSFTSNHAFELRAGTLRFGANVAMDNSVFTDVAPFGFAGGTVHPRFDDFNEEHRIDSDCRLWFDGAQVDMADNGFFSLGGTLEVSGSATVVVNGRDAGYRYQNGGSYVQSGGSVFFSQFRATGGQSTFRMSGGTLTIRQGTGGAGSPNNGEFIFSLETANDAFIMTGGTLNINSLSNAGGIQVLSTVGNYQVSGGVVNVTIPQTVTGVGAAEDFDVNCVPPLFDLNIVRQAGAGVGGRDFRLLAPLTILNDLTIDDQDASGTDEFVLNGFSLTVGRNLTLANDAEINFATGTPTLTFNGNEDGTLTFPALTGFNGGTALGAIPVVVNKVSEDGNDTGTLTLAVAGGVTTGTLAPGATGLLTVSAGSLLYAGFDFRWDGDVTLGATTRIGLDTETGSLLLGGATARTLTVSSTDSTYIGRLRHANTAAAGIGLAGGSELRVHNFVFEAASNGRFDLNTFALTLGNGVTGFDANRYFITNGNDSDGGLYHEIGASGSFTFPVGTDKDRGNRTMTVVADATVTGTGRLRVAPVSLTTGQLALLSNFSASDDQALSAYWVVQPIGFTSFTLTNSSTFGYQGIDIPAAYAAATTLPTGWEFGRVQDINRESLAAAVTTTGTGERTIDLGVDAACTVGTISRFTLGNGPGAPDKFDEATTVRVFYSRSTAIWPQWSATSTWTYEGVTGFLAPTVANPELPHTSPNSGTLTPGPGDIVQIGWYPGGGGGVRTPHVVGAEGYDIACAELRFLEMPDSVQASWGNPWFDRPALLFRHSPNSGDDTPANPAVITATLTRVTGAGMFVVSRREDGHIDPSSGTASDVVLTGDFGDFANQTRAVWEYMGSGPDLANNPLDALHTFPSIPGGVFPTLRFHGPAWGSFRAQLTGTNRINQDLQFVGGPTLVMNTGASGGNLTVGRNVRFDINQGAKNAIEFPGGGTTARTLRVEGDVIMNTTTLARAVIYTDTTTASTLVHRLELGGDVTLLNQSGGLRLHTATANRALVTLACFGEADQVFSRAGGEFRFNRLEVNKGSDSTSTVTFNDRFTLGGGTAGATAATKALQLTNGGLILNPAAAMSITLSSGGADFQIPETVLLAANRNVTFTISNPAEAGFGLDLLGKLALRGAGSSLTMLGDAGGGNDEVSSIEYGVSGSSMLELGGSATLNVGGQIRRSPFTDEGVLSYLQYGTSVAQLGTQLDNQNNATTFENRGIFEIANLPGSSFVMSGGRLQIEGDLDITENAEVILQPFTSSVTGGTIQLGGTNVGTANETILFNSSIPLWALEVQNTNGDFTVNLQSNNLVLQDSLYINDVDATDTDQPFLNLNGFNLTVGGNLNVENGGVIQYTSGSTFTFNGSGTTQRVQLFNYAGGAGTTANSTRSIVDAFTFPNLVVNNPGGTVEFAGFTGTENDIRVLNDLTLTAGTLSISNAGATNRTLEVNGNVTNNGTVSGAGYVVLQNATATVQEITGNGNGAISNLRLNDAQGALARASFRITNNLDLLLNAVLSVDVNQLTLNSAATITATAFGSANSYIDTDGFSSATGGLRKEFSAAGSLTFTYPVGAGGNYTPVALSGTTTSTVGSISVLAISDEASATTGADALNHNWAVTETGITRAGDLTIAATYVDADVDGADADYVGGYLAPTGGSWILTAGAPTGDATDGVDETTNLITFLRAAASPITGTYTAGDVPALGAVNTLFSIAANCLPGPCDFDDAANWSTAGHAGVTSGIAPDLTPGPGGASRVVIGPGHNVSFTDDGNETFSTTLDGGTLSLGATTSHVLNTVSGTGTITMAPVGAGGAANLPDADFTGFVTSATNTLEFGGSGTYNLPVINSALPNYPGVRLVGTGTRQLPSGEATATGDFELDGPTFNLVSAARTLNIQGNLTRTSGTFTANGATVGLTGTASATITGNFGIGNAFANLTFNKTGGASVTLADSIRATGVVTFTSGAVVANTSLTDPLFIFGPSASHNLTGYPASVPASYIQGTARRVSTGANFIFPIGSASFYGPIGLVAPSNDAWTARYNRTSPTGRDAVQPNLVQISNLEFWELNSLGTPRTATVDVFWNYGTGASGDVLSNLSVARNDNPGVTPWTSVGGDPAPHPGSNTTTRGGIRSETVLNFTTEFITYGTELEPLPIELLAFTGQRAEGEVRLRWITAAELNNDRFIVQRSVDGFAFQDVGFVPGAGTTDAITQYSFVDFEAPAAGILYYRLLQVDFDGQMSLSPVIELLENSGSGTPGRTWTVAPNPVVDERFGIVLLAAELDPLSDVHVVRLLATSGQTLATVRGTLNEVNQYLKQVLAKQPAGLYLVQVAAKSFSQQLRVVKN